MDLENIKSQSFSYLGGLQSHLRKITISFIFGFLLTIVSLRSFGWEYFEYMMRSNMPEKISSDVIIIAQTPFEVFLLQMKIGLFMGVIFIIPIFVYEIIDIIEEKNHIDASDIPTYVILGVMLFSFSMVCAGLVYSYNIFFPTIFDFLATLTINAGISPTYAISNWTVFIFILSVSFAVAAQVPVIIPVLVAYDIVSYEKIRNGWRHWVVFTAIFGAFLSPPEPISQILWALPLILLYVISLGISRIILVFKSDKNKDQINQEEKESSKKQISDDENESEFWLSELNIPNLNEETIGKYKQYFDVILYAIRSNIFILLGIFVVSSFGSFYLLFGYATESAIQILNSEVQLQESLNIVELHPVEFLLFQVKVAFIIGILSTVISSLLLVWPHILKQKLSNIPRTKLTGYVVTVICIFLLSSTLTFMYVIPEIINILIYDVDRINGVVAYRISNFFWSIVYLSGGVGFMFSIYTSIVIGFYEDLLDYSVVYSKWRHILFGIIFTSIMITPSGIIKALAISVPISISFLISLYSITKYRQLRSYLRN